MELILGIDPGTTLGYALVSLNGELIEIGSSKEFSMDSFVEFLLGKGKVKYIGVDRKKIPKYVEKLSARLIVEVIKPDDNISKKYKVRFAKRFKVRNRHERDALFSAYFVYRKIRKN